MTSAAVYVINLARRPDRLAAVGQELARAGVAFERVDAVDAQTCDASELAMSRDRGPIGALGNGAKACTASHFRAWRQLLQSPHDFAVVLEDDVAIDPAMGSVLADLSWIKADLVKIEKFGARRPSTLLLGPVLARLAGGRELRSMLSRHTGSAGYIISRNGAKAALAQAGRVTVPVDHFLFNATVSAFSRQIGPAMLVAPLVWQKPAQDSDISPVRDAMDTTARLRRSLVRAAYEARLWPMQLLALATGRARLVKVAVPHR